ncbi:GNAT family N-acetyltransferase [Rhodomicrobium vannielii ATCC 17100]|uniref:GNAT family N-acetyltransferase n=1 Tax=Rhodomicrobium vannielii TaxID=1069 RepID=UPI0019189014|nr:GNAT family N-acetyltransferase [Rhodomicrobium vannielii]MBJ7533646.1 GNAT family N-acetyltransferase [Rhodomicrobium vannielii ATCC 17100]
MTASPHGPFENVRHDLGDALILRPLKPEHAKALGAAMAEIPPWSVVNWSAPSIAASLQREVPALKRFEVLQDGRLAGIVAIQNPFLHGPYLQLFCVLPEFQGRGLGHRLLQWMEGEAHKGGARQLWLCVSTFNTRAEALYRRFGFEQAGLFDKLAIDESDEIFMRKRLF